MVGLVSGTESLAFRWANTWKKGSKVLPAMEAGRIIVILPAAVSLFNNIKRRGIEGNNPCLENRLELYPHSIIFQALGAILAGLHFHSINAKDNQKEIVCLSTFKVVYGFGLFNFRSIFILYPKEC